MAGGLGVPAGELRVRLAFSTAGDLDAASCSLDDDGVQLGIAESGMRSHAPDGINLVGRKGLTQGTADMHLGPRERAGLAAFWISMRQGPMRGLSAGVGHACDRSLPKCAFSLLGLHVIARRTSTPPACPSLVIQQDAEHFYGMDGSVSLTSRTRTAPVSV